MNEMDIAIVVANNVLGHIVAAGTVTDVVDGKRSTTLPDADVAINASLRYAEKFIVAFRQIAEASEKAKAEAAKPPVVDLSVTEPVEGNAI